MVNVDINKRCQIIVDEFVAIEGLKPGNMPVLQCNSYGGELKCIDRDKWVVDMLLMWKIWTIKN